MQFDYRRTLIPLSADGFHEAGVQDWLNAQGAEGWRLVCIQDFPDATRPVATFVREKAPANIVTEAGEITAESKARLQRLIHETHRMTVVSIKSGDAMVRV